MGERPILFSAPMVRALLAGSKIQTRRIVKPQPPHGLERCQYSPSGWAEADERGHGCCTCKAVRAPYGVPGDTLYVKERIDHLGDEVSVYAADMALTVADAWPWKRNTLASIHCPRGLSRITLKITDVRVERLNDISEVDALAEGVEPPASEREDHDWSICPACGGTGLHGALGEHLGYVEVDCTDCDTAAKRYRHLWESINGAGSWDANPWVWAVSFEVIR